MSWELLNSPNAAPAPKSFSHAAEFLPTLAYGKAISLGVAIVTLVHPSGSRKAADDPAYRAYDSVNVATSELTFHDRLQPSIGGDRRSWSPARSEQ